MENKNANINDPQWKAGVEEKQCHVISIIQENQTHFPPAIQESRDRMLSEAEAEGQDESKKDILINYFEVLERLNRASNEIFLEVAKRPTVAADCLLLIHGLVTISSLMIETGLGGPKKVMRLAARVGAAWNQSLHADTRADLISLLELACQPTQGKRC